MRIAILSSTNIDLLPRYMKSVLQGHGIRAEFYLPGFNQYRQEILQGQSGLYQFKPDYILLFLEGEDLFESFCRRPFDHTAEQRQLRVKQELEEIEKLVERMEASLPHALIILNSIVVTPLNGVGGLEYNSDYSLRGPLSHFNDGLKNLLRSRKRCSVIDYERLVCWHGYRDWYDERMWVLGRMRLGANALRGLAREYVGAIRASRGLQKRCLVLDLDNTLWGGEVGSEGMRGIELGMEGIGLAYREFQQEILNLSKRGVILAINSKNNWEDALEVIERHPAMVLRKEHFAAMKINWLDKATNMREIARELNIGLDSFVFIDDSSFERAWIANQLPEVQIVSLPADPALYRRSLLELDAFPVLRLTEEDRERAQLYRQHALVEDLRRAALSVEDFYSGLNMNAKISRANSTNIARIAQLTQKTNQFNLTARRYEERQIALMANSPEYRIYALSLSDRFGDNGLVGVAILLRNGNEERIDSFLLSCRVMGRTVETAFLSFLASEAASAGAQYLVGELVQTKKNSPVHSFYSSHGFTTRDGRWWQLDLRTQTVTSPPYLQLAWLNEGV